MNGQAGKKDEVLSKERLAIVNGFEVLLERSGWGFVLCVRWLVEIKRLRAFGGCLGTERR